MQDPVDPSVQTERLETLAAQRQLTQDRRTELLKIGNTVQHLTVDAVALHLTGVTGRLTTWEAAFRTEFLLQFPELDELVAKYQAQPGCSCRSQLFLFMSEHRAEINTLLDKVYGAHIFELHPHTVRRSAPTGSLVGKTVLIDPSPEAYESYFGAAKVPRRYTGVSVMPATDADGTAKWALLFW